MEKISKNTYKDKAIKLAKQIKKEHFTKLILQISSILLIILWLLLFMFCLIPFGDVSTKPIHTGKTWLEVEEYLGKYNFKEETGGTYSIWEKGDLNALYDIASKNAFITLFCALTPLGFLALLTYISIQKNMITPQAIKKTIRKALQFNYLKQKDVEYISNEIDINIGIKGRDQDEEDEEDEEDE